MGFFAGAENHFNESVCSDQLCLHANGELNGLSIPGVSTLHDLWQDHDALTAADTDKGFGDDMWTDHVIR